MRALTLLLVLSLPALAAAEAPPVTQCTQYTCLVLRDQDGDGVYDRAVFSSAFEHALVANVIHNGSETLVFTELATEELTEPYRVVQAWAYVDADEGVSDAWLYLEMSVADEKTGQSEVTFWQYVEAWDSDGDGVPDSWTVQPELP